MPLAQAAPRIGCERSPSMTCTARVPNQFGRANGTRRPGPRDDRGRVRRACDQVVRFVKGRRRLTGGTHASCHPTEQAQSSLVASGPVTRARRIDGRPVRDKGSGDTLPPRPGTAIRQRPPEADRAESFHPAQLDQTHPRPSPWRDSNRTGPADRETARFGLARPPPADPALSPCHSSCAPSWDTLK
jgi:hypothetical protein